MAEQLDLETFTGAHPTTAQLVDQLRAWGFRQRRVEGVHLVFRGPHGGTVRVLRSLMGRADAAVVAKAARLLGVDPRAFWDGPTDDAEPLAVPPGGPAAREVSGPAVDRTSGPARDHGVVAADDDGVRGVDRAEPGDQIIAQVLAVHVAMDQPLSLGQVMGLCDELLTRAQVSGASSQLCRDGQLVRIRSGVYQWASGAFCQRLAPPHEQPEQPRRPFCGRRRPSRPATPSPAAAATGSTADLTAAPGSVRPVAVVLFEQLFPHGVRMTAEMLGDFERWAQLTEKLTARSAAS